jgi:hypothetical protein
MFDSDDLKHFKHEWLSANTASFLDKSCYLFNNCEGMWSFRKRRIFTVYEYILELILYKGMTRNIYLSEIRPSD